MTELPAVAPINLPAVRPTREQLIEMFTGLEEGHYTTRDLYARYLVWAEGHGQRPVTVQVLGIAIQRTLHLEKSRFTGHVSAWLITPKALAGRDWFVES